MQTATENELCTILVSSCDAYSDLWEPFFQLYRRYWPDRTFDLALITEAKGFGNPEVRALKMGAGRDWSSMLSDALIHLNTPYVLLTLEDFFLRGPVSNKLVEQLLGQMRLNDLQMLRLVPRPGPSIAVPGFSLFGLISREAPYRVSTQASFWDVQTLRHLLVPGERALEFEVNASRLSRSSGTFASVWRPALPYRHHVVERCKWFPWEARRFSRMDIGVDLSARAIMPPLETMHWLCRKVLGPAVAPLKRALLRTLR